MLLKLSKCVQIARAAYANTKLNGDDPSNLHAAAVSKPEASAVVDQTHDEVVDGPRYLPNALVYGPSMRVRAEKSDYFALGSNPANLVRRLLQLPTQD